MHEMITVLATKKFHPDTRKIAVLLVVLGSYNREIIIQAISVHGEGSPKKGVESCIYHSNRKTRWLDAKV